MVVTEKGLISFSSEALGTVEALKNKALIPEFWPDWLGGLTGTNIILSDHPLYSSHQPFQTNTGAEPIARMAIEICNSGHATSALPGSGWPERR